MGWSRSDLARHLRLSSSQITSWEEGELLPELGHENILELLSRHADAQADEMSSQALLDVAFDKDSLSQVSLFELKK